MLEVLSCPEKEKKVTDDRERNSKNDINIKLKV